MWVFEWDFGNIALKAEQNPSKTMVHQIPGFQLWGRAWRWRNVAFLLHTLLFIVCRSCWCLALFFWTWLSWDIKWEIWVHKRIQSSRDLRPRLLISRKIFFYLLFICLISFFLDKHQIHSAKLQIGGMSRGRWVGIGESARIRLLNLNKLWTSFPLDSLQCKPRDPVF